MTKMSDWVMDFDGLASTLGLSGYQMDEMRELFRQALFQQREEILDKVEESNQNEYDNGFEDGIDRTIKEVDKVLDWKQWEKDLIKANVSSTLLNLYRSANKELNKRLNKVKLR